MLVNDYLLTLTIGREIASQFFLHTLEVTNRHAKQARDLWCFMLRYSTYCHVTCSQLY